MRAGARPRYLLSILVTLPLVLSGKPQDALSERVAALEAQVAAQQAELNRQPIVVDANGVRVGSTVHGVYSNVGTLDSEQRIAPFVLFRLEGLPLFGLEVHRQSLETPNSGLAHVYFDASDCRGRVLFRNDAVSASFILPRVFVHRSRTDVPIYVEGPLTSPPDAGVGTISRLSETDATCQNIQNQGGSYAEALDTGIHWRSHFTPPFSVIPSGELTLP
jgi:hypothetical protein